jgi:Sulfotransferase family
MNGSHHSEPLRVLYISGMGRSGSTLLARALGQVEGLFNAGEAMRFLFHSDLFSRLRQCGCGEEVSRCPFWEDLVAGIDPEVRGLATRQVRIRRLPALLGFGGPRAHRLLDRLAAVWGETLSEISRRSACRVIVDASKNPATGALLARVPGIELHVLHLVRDPRAVVESWSHPKQYLRRHGALKVTAWWLLYNLATELLGRRAQGYVRIRFEEMAGDMAAQVAEVLRRSGVEGADLAFIEPHRIRLSPQHALAGNPDKFAVGWVPIRRPAEPAAGRLGWLVTLMTLPLLRRYGYLAPGSGRGDGGSR